MGDSNLGSTTDTDEQPMNSNPSTFIYLDVEKSDPFIHST